MYGAHRDLHVLTHTCPTRLSSDLSDAEPAPSLRRTPPRPVTTRRASMAPIATSRPKRESISRSRASMSWASQAASRAPRTRPVTRTRSEEHTSELQSLMRISYAVFCLKKKKQKTLNKDRHK